jgi:predicted aspartyl protease
MIPRAGLSALLLYITAVQLPQAALAETCSLAKVADLHVTVTPSNEILVDGSIKGEPAKFLIDTGTNGTIFDAAVFSRFGISSAGEQTRLRGITGESGAVYRTIPDLKFGNFVGDNLHWTVAENHFLPDGVYAIIGYDFLGSFDIDLDLAHNTISLFQHNSCSSEPVYWSQSFSEADLSIRENKLSVAIEVNGTPAEARFDSGSSRTLISTRLTRRIGFDETAPGMTKVGLIHGGDSHTTDVYTYRFAELHVGDEVIKNPLLHVERSLVLKVDTRMTHGAQLNYDQRPDAFLGVDFIKTHHIYLAPKERKMYFTYNGGGIFSPPQDNSVVARDDN